MSIPIGEGEMIRELATETLDDIQRKDLSLLLDHLQKNTLFDSYVIKLMLEVAQEACRDEIAKRRSK